MNSQQLLSLLRTLIQVAVAYAVGRGWIDASIASALSDQLVALAAAVAAIAVTAWGIYVRRNSALVKQGAAASAAIAGPAVQPAA